MKRVLVTGSNGQLGKSLQEVSGTYPEITFTFKSSRELDITKTDEIEALFFREDFDYCINCAAYTDVEKAEQCKDVAFAVNAEGVKNLALVCANTDTILIHISTDYVFDGEKEGAYTVEDTPNPINEYGKSKLAGENHVRRFLDRYFIVRTSWLYSAYGNNFYKTILKKAELHQELQITDEQTGCPTKAVHLADFLLKLITEESADYGIHHFTDGMAMTWYDFAERILVDNHLRKHVSLEKAKNYRTFARRPRNSILK